MNSSRFELKREDVKKILNNAAIFFAPALLVFLLALRTGVPIEQAAIAIGLWVLDVIIDLVRKYIKDNTK